MDRATNRLEELRSKYQHYALELGLVSGRVSPETGSINSDYKSDPMQDAMELQVLEILDFIDKQGHTGFTRSYLVSLLIPLLTGNPITPLTGNDWEWSEKRFFGGPFQNKRCPKVFKEKSGLVYNSNGRAFSDDNGKTWFTSSDSWKEITFPCSTEDLKTEYIMVDTEKKGVL
jgi:hypothetical protein